MEISALKKTHIKNLQWAILLSRTDLQRCTEGDRLNLTEAFYGFIYWADEEFKKIGWDKYKTRRQEGYYFVPIPFAAFSPHITPELLATLQTSFQNKLELIAKGLPAQLWKATGVQFSVVVSKRSGSFVRFFSPVLKSLSDDLLSVAEYALIEHLIESGITADQIRNCPECGSLFLSKTKPRADRKRYCPYGNCAVKSAKRAYTARNQEKAKAKERKRGAARYREKIGGRFPNAPILKREPRKRRQNIRASKKVS